MRLTNLETHGIDQFLFTLKKTESESLNPHGGKPVAVSEVLGIGLPLSSGSRAAGEMASCPGGFSTTHLIQESGMLFRAKGIALPSSGRRGWHKELG